MEAYFGDAAAHAAALKQIAAEAHPGNEVCLLDNNGGSSNVIRVNDLIYKGQHCGIYPPEVAARREAAITNVLPPKAELATGTTLTVPQLISARHNRRPAHNVLSFVPGNVLSLKEITSFDETEKMQLGKDLGSFIVWLTNVVPADIYERIRSQVVNTGHSITELLRELRLPHVKMIRTKGYSNTANLLEELASTPLPPYDDPDSPPVVTCHGDLRPNNMTFDHRRLQGVFDFEYITRSDPAEELRFTGFMGLSVAKAAIEQFFYETEITIPLQRLIRYAGVQAIFAATYQVIHDKEKGAFLDIYHDFLKQQYPDKDWSELDRFATSDP